MLISTIITSIFTIFDDMASEYQKMDAFANDTNFAEISLVFLMWALPQNCKRTSKETRLWPRPKDHRPSTRFLAAIFRRKDMEWTVDKGRTDIEAFIEWLWIVVNCCDMLWGCAHCAPETILTLLPIQLSRYPIQLSISPALKLPTSATRCFDTAFISVAALAFVEWRSTWDLWNAERNLNIADKFTHPFRSTWQDWQDWQLMSLCDYVATQHTS